MQSELLAVASLLSVDLRCSHGSGMHFCRSICAWGACLLGWIWSLRSCGFLFVLRGHLYALQSSLSSLRVEMFDAVGGVVFSLEFTSGGVRRSRK